MKWAVLLFAFPLAAALVVISAGLIAPFHLIRSRRYALPLADLVSYLIGGASIISLALTVVLQDAENIAADARFTGHGMRRAFDIMREVRDEAPTLCSNPSSLDCIEATRFLTRVVGAVATRGAVPSEVVSVYRSYDPTISPSLKSKFEEYFLVVDAAEADKNVALEALIHDVRSYLVVLLAGAFALGCWRRLLSLRLVLNPDPPRSPVAPSGPRQAA